MGSFGERLRREREMRGISLDEIATATKISSRNLRALEEEKFNQLPGGIFNKGFVRAYAKFLGIDEDHMVAEYVAASADTEAARDQKLKTELSRAEFKRDEERREISLEPKSQWGTIVVIVLIAGMVFGGYEYYQKKKTERLQRAQAPVPSPVVPAPAAVVPAPATPTSNSAQSSASTTSAGPGSSSTVPQQSGATAETAKPPETTSRTAADPAKLTQPATAEASTASSPLNSGPIDVKIHAKQDSWVSITADGKTIMKGTLAASSEKAVRAKDQIVVVLGNAGGVEVSYKGKPLENLGKGQEVKKITFTSSGYE